MIMESPLLKYGFFQIRLLIHFGIQLTTYDLELSYLSAFLLVFDLKMTKQF